MKVRVYHSYYGCDTGCCGHIVELKDAHPARKRFEFEHPESLAEARELAEDVIRERWPECIDSLDWSTFTFEDTCRE